jgi:hypothetical protein|tara:strand:- start:215 stop:496 length:282 start_codon:yes stop_codon:yes gene_type:complete
MPQGEQKISFGQLDNFLKIAPIIGICALAYLQTLFPSKQDFEKIHDTMHEVEKQVIQLTALQNNVTDNSRAIADIQKTIQEIQINIVKLQKAP